MPTEIFASEIDYETRILNASTAIVRTISPQGANSVLLSQTSNVGPVEFIIPASCFCPAKSRLNFSFNHAAVAAKSSWMNANALTTINRIVMYDQSTNAQWLDVSSLHEYASLSSTIGTPLTDFLTKGYSSATPATTLATAQLNTTEDITKVNSATNFTVAMDGTALDAGAGNQFMGRRQRYIGAVGGALALDFSIPFSAFKMTALALNKILYNPSNLVLQVYFNSTDTFLFQSDANNAITNPTSLPAVSAPTIANLSVSLCNEGSLSIVGQLIETVMKRGISLPIAYPTTTRNSIAASSQHSFVNQLTRGYGQRILHILTAPFSNVALVGSCVHGRGALTFVNDFINNVALKYPNGYNILRSQDYTINIKETAKRSALQTLTTYADVEWLLLDSFVGDVPFCEVDQTVIAGLDCSNQSSSWQLQATLSAATAYTWVSCIIGQKVLSISNQGSVVV